MDENPGRNELSVSARRPASMLNGERELMPEELDPSFEPFDHFAWQDLFFIVLTNTTSHHPLLGHGLDADDNDDRSMFDDLALRKDVARRRALFFMDRLPSPEALHPKPDRRALGRALALAKWADGRVPLDPELVFSKRTICLYVDTALNKLSPQECRSVREDLLIFRSLYSPPGTDVGAIDHLTPAAPYSRRRQRELDAWASGQTVEKQADAWILLALGLGGGLKAKEIATVSAKDVHVFGNRASIRVSGTFERTVPVRTARATKIIVDRKRRLSKSGSRGLDNTLFA
ncbi:MAG: hypothetical protein ACHP7F_00170 [Actinomycetales bacterium]